MSARTPAAFMLAAATALTLPMAVAPQSGARAASTGAAATAAALTDAALPTSSGILSANGWYRSEPQITRWCYVSYRLRGLRVAICTAQTGLSAAAFLSVKNTSRTAINVSVPRVRSSTGKVSCGKRRIAPGALAACFVRDPETCDGRVIFSGWGHLRVGNVSRTYTGPQITLWCA